MGSAILRVALDLEADRGDQKRTRSLCKSPTLLSVILTQTPRPAALAGPGARPPALHGQLEAIMLRYEARIRFSTGYAYDQTSAATSDQTQAISAAGTTTSCCNARYSRHEQITERRPKGDDAIVRGQVPAQRAVPAVGVAVKSDMLHQEMPESLQRGTLPIRGPSASL